MALAPALQPTAADSRGRTVLAMIGIIGAGLFFGDGIITPAVSVLSAVEGLEVTTPELQPYVVPIACGGDRRACSPCSIAAPARSAGSSARSWRPGSSSSASWARARWSLEPADPVSALLAPSYGTVLHGTMAGWRSWPSAPSCCPSPGRRRFMPTWAISGRRRSAGRGWAFVLPCLVLNYFGQGALILREPGRHREPLLPDGVGQRCACPWSCWPRPPPSSPARR